MRIEPLRREHEPAFRRLVQRAWQRPDSEAYYRWRYFDAPSPKTLVAMRGAECVATISAFERRYLQGGRVLSCLEPFDWYTVPEMRPTAVGLRLMKALLAGGLPAIGVGGSPFTLQLLPKLGWRKAGEATQFVLPLTAAYLLRKRRVPALARRAAFPLLDRAAAAWFTPPPCARPYEAVPVGLGDPRLARIDGCAGVFRSVPEPAFLEWLQRGSAVGCGRYIAFVVQARGEALAWSLGRLYRSDGLLRGAILDVRVRDADADLALAAVCALARDLACKGADAIRASVTAPLVADALRRAGFRARGSLPVNIWSARQPLDPGALSLACVADAAFLPLQGLPAEQPEPLAALAGAGAVPQEPPARGLGRWLLAARLHEKKRAVAGGR